MGDFYCMLIAKKAKTLPTTFAKHDGTDKEPISIARKLQQRLGLGLGFHASRNRSSEAKLDSAGAHWNGQHPTSLPVRNGAIPNLNLSMKQK